MNLVSDADASATCQMHSTQIALKMRRRSTSPRKTRLRSSLFTTLWTYSVSHFRGFAHFPGDAAYCQARAHSLRTIRSGYSGPLLFDGVDPALA
jgi:hypothetical protein